mmetsp:Transcript_63704/g.170394  ORF Transcript_63704/g.170394 Transcript_63704/m.170394 type:complete len:112 (+) Transcript_63704:243-578(+)
MLMALRLLPQTTVELCCEAQTAACLACAQGVSVEEFCGGSPATEGCEGAREGVSTEEYCEAHPGADGCGSPSGKACCLALTAPCLACAANVSTEDYCQSKPETSGCGAGGR